MTYSEKLKDPRWQKKRLQILERDGWECQNCFDKESTLTVHHKKYTTDYIWEEPDQNLITLCERCHTIFHEHKELRYENEEYYIPFRVWNLTATDIWLIENRIISLIYKYRADSSRRIIESLKGADYMNEIKTN